MILNTSHSLFRKGFSMIELIIVVALTVIIMTVLVYFFVGYSKTFRYIEANFLVSGSASVTVDSISNAVHQANQIATSHSFSGTTYTTGTSTIVLELPTVNASGNIVSGSHDYMVFYKTGTDIFLISAANGSSARPSFTKKMSETAQTLSFTYDDSDVTTATKVDIDLQTSKAVKGQDFTQHVHAQAYLRNI